ncbi:predicted protein [Histoplasma capsulatum G186AR]|uniref:Uncharacterized protein n=1 Tax=Ajellomyces capsulatus (strain G186AR / H82 / ATCC MYA-2454 / RMSCC 2432) TaxID=447093 RepID=C0NQ74_AJECG|nr:uncharacterized protein HCBG_05662 [Histoplasma capsulatum G186AR]EEH06346.1 predicted protein [Histoplasma capsulatum G186AR]
MSDSTNPLTEHQIADGQSLQRVDIRQICLRPSYHDISIEAYGSDTHNLLPHIPQCIELRIRGQNDRNSSPVAASSIQASDGDVSKSAKAVNGRGMRAEGDRSGKALLV